MSDEYQLRKDIDRFKGFLDALEHTINTKYGISVEDIEQLLSRFYDVSDIDLLKIKLNNDLDSLNSSLDDLSLDLYGSEGVDGFVDYLNELQHSIYGKGDKDSSGRDYTIDYPSPSSLKGLLNTLNTDTSKLKETLTILATYLTNFTGTLAQFKQELANHGISYSSLDTGITQLLEGIFKAQADINTVQEDIGDVSQISGTVIGNIQNVDNKAVDIRKKLYSGTNDTGTIDNPASNTVKANINTVQSDVTNVKGDVSTLQGNVDYLLLSNSSWQILHCGSVDSISVNDLLTHYPYFKFEEVNYADGGYVRDGASWVRHDMQDILDKVEITFVTCLSFIQSVKTTLQDYDLEYCYVYEIGTNSFYTNNQGTWEKMDRLDLYAKIFQRKIGGSLFDLIYPVGSIYMSVQDTSPSLLLGGTWVKIEDKFLLSSGTNYPATYDSNGIANKTGGEANHTLTVDEIPSHNHLLRTDWGDMSGNVPYDRSGNTYSLTVDENKAYTRNTGGGQAHNNMPPYLVVNVWYRTQ